jgi:uncharacterized SAM-binding protein YcdF (DUF218 family)
MWPCVSGYFLKQVVGMLAQPLTVAVIIAVIGLIVRLGGKRKLVPWLLATAGCVAYLGATPVFGDALLGPLERSYPPFREDTRLPRSVSHLMVLGSSYQPRGGVPITAALDDEGLIRAVEGIRLVRKLAIPHLILSGGAPPGQSRPADGYFMLARSLGIDPDSCIILGDSLDTADESRAVASLLGSAPFVLVTSAAHMPRAMRLMRRAGANPIPAPTGQRASGRAGVDLRRGLPSASGLRKTERALHEYVGLLALRLGFS